MLHTSSKQGLSRKNGLILQNEAGKFAAAYAIRCHFDEIDPAVSIIPVAHITTAIVHLTPMDRGKQ